ncbi:MAG TPA: pentapeptide repeat-containing protein [Gammaproteobacteria bacterium]|nr:pentapeptide repeat-containing protein [Gammaproteobacteria bacterium]
MASTRSSGEILEERRKLSETLTPLIEKVNITLLRTGEEKEGKLENSVKSAFDEAVAREANLFTEEAAKKYFRTKIQEPYLDQIKADKKLLENFHYHATQLDNVPAHIAVSDGSTGEVDVKPRALALGKANTIINECMKYTPDAIDEAMKRLERNQRIIQSLHDFFSGILKSMHEIDQKIITIGWYADSDRTFAWTLLDEAEATYKTCLADCGESPRLLALRERLNERTRELDLKRASDERSAVLQQPVAIHTPPQEEVKVHQESARNAPLVAAHHDEKKSEQKDPNDLSRSNFSLVPAKNVAELTLLRHLGCEVDLSNRDFSRKILSSSNFSGAKCVGADFTEAKLDNVSFNDADLLGAKFDNAEMHGAILTGAKCTLNQFSPVQIMLFDYRENPKTPAYLSVIYQYKKDNESKKGEHSLGLKRADDLILSLIKGDQKPLLKFLRKGKLSGEGASKFFSASKKSDPNSLVSRLLEVHNALMNSPPIEIVANQNRNRRKSSGSSSR